MSNRIGGYALMAIGATLISWGVYSKLKYDARVRELQKMTDEADAAITRHVAYTEGVIDQTNHAAAKRSK